MKKIAILIVLSIAIVGFLSSNAKAFTTIKADESGNVTVEGNETINDNVATAGNIVIIRGTIDDDLFVAGQDIKIEGDVNGSLFAIGNQIEIAGIVGKDTMVAGNIIDISKSSTITRDLFAAGNMVTVSGPVGRNAYFGTSNLTINSIINGNVLASFSDINLSGGQILGKLTYSAEKSINIDPALVTGGITFNEIVTKETPKNEQVMSWLMRLLTAIVIGIVFVLIVPKWTKNISEQINKNLFKSMGIGLLILIVAPIISLLLLITVVGIPLSIITMVIYFMLMYLAKFWVAYCLGSYIGKDKLNPMISMTIGILILYLIFAIPFIGGFAGFIVLLLGIGGVYLSQPFKNAK